MIPILQLLLRSVLVVVFNQLLVTIVVIQITGLISGRPLMRHQLMRVEAGIMIVMGMLQRVAPAAKLLLVRLQVRRAVHRVIHNKRAEPCSGTTRVGQR